MPNSRFMRDMGMGSIVAGIVMLGLAALRPEKLIRKVLRGR